MAPRRRILAIIVLALWLLSGGLLISDAAFTDGSFEGVAAPYRFDLPGWEGKNLIGMGKARIGRLFHGPSSGDLWAVEEYFRQAREIRRLERQLVQGTGGWGDVVENLERAREARARLEERVEAVLGGQIADVLAREGLSLSPVGRPLLPPLAFEFDGPPLLLVDSPRGRIELRNAAVLKPGLTSREIEEIEARVEGLGGSALVERLGGIATYPSLVPETTTLERALSTIAHEWLHHYLFFNPLGRRYGQSREMTTINETAANMGGNEIGREALRRFWRREPREEEVKPQGAFDFDREMRNIRLAVDSYLARGEVEKAEDFMGERRGYLAEQGYFIRRLNQAYFAYHGTYADSAASTNPIGPQLKVLRERSASLGVFIRTVSRLSSYEELKGMVGKG